MQQIRQGPSKRQSGAKRRYDRDRPSGKRKAQRRAGLLSRDAGGSSKQAASAAVLTEPFRPQNFHSAKASAGKALSTGAALGYTQEMKCFRFFLGFFLAVPLLIPAAQPKPSDDSDPVFSGQVDVNIVNVDVFVRNAKGHPVEALSPEDFRISMDGVLQKISNFAAIDEELIQSRIEAEKLGPSPGSSPENEGNTQAPEDTVLRPIWVVLYIDNENLDPIDRTRALRRIREFVLETLHPPMKMMVVANQAGLRVIQDFSDDSTEITSALRGLSKYSGGWIERKSTRMEIISDMEDTKNRGYGTSNQADTAESSQQGVYQRILAVAREEANDLDFSIMALKQVVDTLAGLEGRKSILYVSNGLPMTPGLGLMHEYATLYHDNSILASRGRYNHQRQFQALSSRASSQDINFYTVDAAGLDVGLGGGAESSYGADPTATRIGESNFQGPMRYLAERTGGIAVINTNDISAGLKKIRNDFYSYYSLGFEIRTESNDVVHRIEVALPGRKDLDVRFRRRFIARSLESRIQDRVSSALLLDIDENPMGLHLRFKGAETSVGERWMVPVILEVPLKEITFLPFNEELVGRVELFIGARNANGDQSDLQQQHHEIRRSPAKDRIDQGVWTYEARLLMGKGSQRIVIAVLDEITHKVSYVSANIRVP